MRAAPFWSKIDVALFVLFLVAFALAVWTSTSGAAWFTSTSSWFLAWMYGRFAYRSIYPPARIARFAYVRACLAAAFSSACIVGGILIVWTAFNNYPYPSRLLPGWLWLIPFYLLLMHERTDIRKQLALK
jgi:hypothetical protein